MPLEAQCPILILGFHGRLIFITLWSVKIGEFLLAFHPYTYKN